MKTIFVSTDFTEASINAVRFAADLALAVNASLTVYHAVAVRQVVLYDVISDTESTENSEAHANLKYVRDVVRTYTHNRLAVSCHVKYGSITEVMQHECKANLPLALVMSPTEKSAVERFMLGSGTLSLSHKLTVPLLIIPSQSKFTGFHKIALATDLSNVMTTLPLEAITHWLQPFHAGLDLVFVDADDRMDRNNVTEAVALQTHFKEFYPTFRFMKDKDVAKGLHTYLVDGKKDLLIIIPKKHSLFHVSISKDMVLHSTIPTLFFPHA